MKILLCHERFLFRFGADRVMMIIGKGLRELGHEITVMANRCDGQAVGEFASRIIDVPAEGADYFNLSESTAYWLKRSWNSLFDSRTRPDIVLSGGWPFFDATSLFREKCKAVVFMDHGVVPLDGYPEGTKRILTKLVGLRRRALPHCSAITCVSQFLAASQSIPDCDGSVPVHVVWNGADHLEMSMWRAGKVGAAEHQGFARAQVESLQRRGQRTVLLLGRWEPGCYKNSDAAFGLLRSMKGAAPDACLLILADPGKCEIPLDLRSAVYPLGFPDDAELMEVMKRVDLGISVSLWEGFNLPLAEMQWLDRPALALALGAHPEVIVHPWYLCRDIAEMTAKSCDVLEGRGPDREARQEAHRQFRQRFTWQRAVEQYSKILDELVEPEGKTVQPERIRVSLIMDVSNSTIDPANSGVIRVTRRLGRELQKQEDPLFVTWDVQNKRYVLPTREEYQQLGQFNGPVVTSEKRISPSYENRIGLDEALEALGADQPWLLMSETMFEERFQHIRPYARARGFRLAAVFHDAIPVLRPDLCNRELRDNHAAYMKGLAQCDLVFPNSNYSAQCLLDFWKETGIAGCQVIANVLPGEFGGFPRTTQHPDVPSSPVHIVCVSTLEPRKNHQKLIQACLRMQEKHPTLDWKLTLVGNRYAGASEIAEFVEEASRRNARIQWLGIVDDETLHRLYSAATFTVYPSIIEGFGMPILESIWHGRACICSEEGVMGELAREGGCLTTNVNDELLLSEAIASLASDPALRRKLEREAVSRPMKTWDAYVRELSPAIRSAKPGSPSLPGWRQILYPRCLLDKWQMFESERMALTALLARRQPECSVEVGTYKGGSLSLIAQYSKMVFSVDIDPEVPEKLGPWKNVSFLTGQSGLVMPLLLKELDAKGIAVEFILIDADHSAEGVKRDTAWLLDYVPKTPLFVMLHDSFNPECRRGMLETPWDRSPYCHWVDLDLVPGRIVEHGGPTDGEMWGGLALAYFLPQRRRGALAVGQSAGKMFAFVRASQPDTRTRAAGE